MVRRHFILLFFLCCLSSPTWPGGITTYKYPSNQEYNLNGAALGQCFVAATVLSNNEYSLSKSKMISPYHDDLFKKYLNADDGESTTRYKTGYEEDLKAWILKQPDNSIDPITLYQKSLELSKGNVWNAFLCIFDLLRNNARFYDSPRYNYPEFFKNVEGLFNKFIDIRGDLKERGGKFVGDHTGSWYRIWLFPLYLMTHLDEKPARLPLSTNKCCHINVNLRDQIALLYLPEKLVIARAGVITAEYGKVMGGGTAYEPDAAGKVRLDEQFMTTGTSVIDGLWFAPMAKDEARQVMEKCKQRNYLEKR